MNDQANKGENTVNIVRVRGHFEVKVNGKFQFSADNWREVCTELKELKELKV